MKSRITGKPADKKTIDELIKEMNINDAKVELENIENQKIIESGQKKKVNSEVFYDNFDTSDCRFCMNFDYRTEECKKHMPNINPWYTKDMGIPDECEEWDYIYEEENEE